MSDARGRGSADTQIGMSGDDLIVGEVVGEFRVECMIGKGGMGCVYGAIHPVIGKRAAIKILRKELCTDRETIDRFVQEARAVNQIGHPNIVDIFTFGALPDGRSYLIMEWLAGESLRARVKRGPLARDEIRDLLGDVIRALEAAHAKGIVHRDLKPDNVFLVDVHGERPRAKLLDFGIAKLTSTDQVNRTRTGSMLGTPQYISPEQARGYGVDHRSDVYALGVMLFELVAGVPPFEANNAADMISMHLLEAAPRLSTRASDISVAFDQLVDSMLAKEADDRPELERVRLALDELAVRPGTSTARTLDVRPTARDAPAVTGTGATADSWVHRPRSRGPAIAIVVAVVLVTAAIVAFVVLRNPTETSTVVLTLDAAVAVPPPIPVDAVVVTTLRDAAPAATGTLEIRTRQPRGITITIDGGRRSEGPNRGIVLSAGSHKIVVSRGKLRIAARTIEIESGKLETIHVDAARAGAAEPEDPDALREPGKR